MKIIRISTFLDFGGIERKMENVSSWDDENEWIFAALNKGGVAEKAIRENGKRVLVLNLPYRIPSIKTIVELYKIFKKEKPDVVHTSGAEANFHGVIAAKLSGVKKVVAEEIGIPNHKKKTQRVFQMIFALSDAVAGESQKVVDNLSKKYKIPSNKLFKIYNFISPKTIPKKEKDESIFQIISVARLEAVKNIEMALHALHKLNSENIDFEYNILGSGTEMDHLVDLRDSLQLTNKVHFLGFKSDPISYLCTSDLFLLTSNNEGFSNALLEAMYVGLPVVSTRVGGADDIIVNNENGWLVDVDNVADLVTKLKKVINLSQEDRCNIGHKARQSVLDNFTLEKHIESLYSLYSS